MGYVTGDPYWLNLRHPSVCFTCGDGIAAGDAAFYWPKAARGRRCECGACGVQSEQRFREECAMESNERSGEA
jgi:hypothetical protein